MLALPSAILTRNDYCIWLARFLGLYEPLEHVLAKFPEWDTCGISLPMPNHSVCIAGDLAALGVDPASEMRAPQAALPNLPTFAHALGALYVLEGATLGGRLILRDVQTRIGADIAGAARFFGGRGDAAGARWLTFRAALDAFGNERPLLRADVVAGAEGVFRAILAWFAPFCAAAAEPR